MLGQAGLIYGLVSQAIWISSAIRCRGTRLVAITLIVIIGALLLDVQMASGDTLRHFRDRVADVGGMVIAQSIIFFLFGISSWQAFGEDVLRPRRQFSTLDIAALTLITAVVLSLSMNRTASIEITDYWLGMIGIWIGLPVLVAVTAQGAIRSSKAFRLAATVFSAFLTVLGGASLLAMELAHRQLSKEAIDVFIKTYGAFLGSFFLCCLFFPLAGRADQETKYAQRRSKRNAQETSTDSLDDVASGFPREDETCHNAEPVTRVVDPGVDSSVPE